MAGFTGRELVGRRFDLVNGDRRFSDLVLKVHSIQKDLKRVWMRASIDTPPKEDPLDATDSDPGYVLVDHTGLYTFMPSFGSYSELWSRIMFSNPVEFAWLDFDCKDLFSLKFLSIVVDTLSQQVDLWACDLVTRGLSSFKYFVDFYDALRDLYEYKVNDIAIIS